MKIIFIIHTIGFILFWLGILSVLSTAHKNKEQVMNAIERKSNDRSEFSNWLILIVSSIIPVLNYLVAFVAIFNPTCFWEEN